MVSQTWRHPQCADSGALRFYRTAEASTDQQISNEIVIAGLAGGDLVLAGRAWLIVSGERALLM
jgi:hypothetical protein